jgi:thiosulfate/3-mercaptopyruvate sulfurtransferase
MATRLYWQLKYYGQDEIAILNGGMAQWLNERRGVDSKADKPQPGNWRATAERKELLATSADVANAVDKKSAQLVDTRSLPLYFGTGKKSYVYAKGHIPGAKPFPNELLTQPSVPAKFTPIDELRSLAKEMGVDTDANTITYCNSGHLASGSWFVLHELMGNKNVKLYDGSMHQWTMEERPVTSFKME